MILISYACWAKRNQYWIVFAEQFARKFRVSVPDKLWMQLLCIIKSFPETCPTLWLGRLAIAYIIAFLCLSSFLVGETGLGILKFFCLPLYFRWCWDIEHDREDWGAWVHGIWESLQVWRIVPQFVLILDFVLPSLLSCFLLSLYLFFVFISSDALQSFLASFDAPWACSFSC